jgi:hypothetical protein
LDNHFIFELIESSLGITLFPKVIKTALPGVARHMLSEEVEEVYMVVEVCL